MSALSSLVARSGMSPEESFYNRNHLFVADAPAEPAQTSPTNQPTNQRSRTSSRTANINKEKVA
jgi:hypothetical protein